MSNGELFDFSSFVSANPERNISGFDYLHIVYKSQRLPADFILWLAKLFRPDFKIVDGLVFVVELFDSERYQSLLGGDMSVAEVQLWMNLLEITGLFDDLSSNQAIEMAKALTDSWNAKLHQEIGITTELAKTIYDKETGEVFVTIGIHK
jgi:hypothetical protein